MWALEYNEKRAARIPAKPISGGFVPPERGTPEFAKTRQVALRRGVPMSAVPWPGRPEPGALPTPSRAQQAVPLQTARSLPGAPNPVSQLAGAVGRGVQTARQGLAEAYSSVRDALRRPPSDDAVYKRIQGLSS